MTDPTRRQLLAAAPALAAAPYAPAAGPASADVVVYGATSSGVVAAVQAARMGKSVALLEPTRHVGGLTAGGLGATDLEHQDAYGGLAREFYRRVAKHYARPDAWACQDFAAYRRNLGPYHARHLSPDLAAPGAVMFTFEPKVASALFAGLLREAGVAPQLGARLRRPGGVVKDGNRVRELVLDDGRRVAGRVFLDATYEGDLLAEAGVSFHVGREDNAVYGERWNGNQPDAGGHQFLAPVDPYVEPGRPESGLLWGVEPDPAGTPGAGDRRVQAYNLRLTLTDHGPNRLPVEKPAGYDPARYELLARYLATGKAKRVWSAVGMPNRKTDTNNHGPFGTDLVGGSRGWPEAGYAERERLYREHRDYAHGLLWFLANDPRVPPALRASVGKWGPCRDEFAATGGWTPQVYVREARRMVGAYVMTEADCAGGRVAPGAVGLACYGLDSHHVRRYARGGSARAEGNVQVGGLVPYPVAYAALTPREAECANLLASVCVSASHIAYGSVRMEPVFMALGQSAATAAALALDAGVPVQRVDYAALRRRLLADGQVLDPKPGRKADPKLRLEPD